MCDCGFTRGIGWKGWPALLPSRPDAGALPRPVSPWIDLSHPLDRNLPRVPFFPAPIFDRFYSIPGHQLNVTRMNMVVHMGTHVDSPRHFFEDGPAFEDIPLERLCGQGLVWPVRVTAGREIEPEQLQAAESLLAPGDILILETGSHRFVGAPNYDDHPALSRSAADWVIDQGIKLLGVDTPTPDCAVVRRGADFDYPIHRLLLANGVLIAEHLTNLRLLTGRRVELIFNALNIAGGDGAPTRVLGRLLSR